MAFGERDPAPSFQFNAVIEELERKRRSGRPMLRSVGVAPGRSVQDEIGGSSAEPGRVGISAPEERIGALEESIRQMEARWLAARPIGC